MSTKPKKINVIYYRAGHPVELCQIEDTLQDVQHLVGGFIEHVTLPHGLSLVCNEEGRLLDLPVTAIVTIPANPPFGVIRHHIHGNFFVCRSKDCEFASVQEGDMDLVREMVIPVS